ncbi:hypothetical protein GCM10029992_35760 [Glycomyces albus]
MPDSDVHTWLGWGFTAVAALGPLLRPRGAVRLVRESVRFDRSDARWLVRWPKAACTGRFAYHDGHFDPSQRIANLVMIILLAALLVSGIGLWAVSGGPMFVWFNRIHRWSTYRVTPVIIGHILMPPDCYRATGASGGRCTWEADSTGATPRRSGPAGGGATQTPMTIPARPDDGHSYCAILTGRGSS